MQTTTEKTVTTPLQAQQDQMDISLSDVIVLLLPNTKLLTILCVTTFANNQSLAHQIFQLGISMDAHAFV